MYRIEAYEDKPYGMGMWKILNKIISDEDLKKFTISSGYKHINIWDIKNKKYLIMSGNVAETKEVIKKIVVESWDD